MAFQLFKGGTMKKHDYHYFNERRRELIESLPKGWKDGLTPTELNLVFLGADDEALDVLDLHGIEPVAV